MKALALPSFAAGLIVALLSAPAMAQNTDAANQLDAVVKNGKLRVCTTGDYKPFTFHDKTANSYQGIDIDLAKSLASSLGVEAEFVETTWKTLLPDFTAGKCDIAMGGISVTLERQKQVFFSEPYLINGKAPIARCADTAKFQTIADIDKPLQYGEVGYMLPEGAVVFKAYVDQWVHLAKATGEFDRIYDSHVK